MHEKQVFCKNVKKLRENYGYSKLKMAKILGIGIKSLSLIERGILPPRLKCEVLIRIANHFGISPSDMFTQIKL